MTVPGKGSQQTIELVSSTALLMFRQVLLYEPYGATSTPVPGASASASPSATPSVSGSPSATATPSASSTSTAKTSAKILPAASARAQRVRERYRVTERIGHRQPLGQPQRQPEFARDQRRGRQPSLVHKDVLAKFDKLVCKPGDTQAWKAQVGYVTTTPTTIRTCRWSPAAAPGRDSGASSR